jgi:hypothetical protein
VCATSTTSTLVYFTVMSCWHLADDAIGIKGSFTKSYNCHYNALQHQAILSLCPGKSSTIPPTSMGQTK